MSKYLQHLSHWAKHLWKAVSYRANHVESYMISHPNQLLAVLTVAIVLWLWAGAMIGRKADEKGQSFWYGFFLSAFAGPIIGLAFVACLRPAKSARRISRSAGSRKRLSVTRERVA